MKTTINSLLALLLLLALPAFAGPDMIERGSDLWRTSSDGSTKVDFRFDPIPAGFFCKGSEPYTGSISFRGVPLATVPAGILGSVDTIVERLDNAAFDKSGLASTRIRVLALSFEGLAPIQTSCGAFQVTAGLNGEQPFTEMRILKETETGGSYEAPIAVNIRMTFEPVNGKGWPVHLDRELRFRAIPNAKWSLIEEADSKLAGWGDLFVDTNGDDVADSYVPAPTSFVAGSNFLAATKLVPRQNPECHLAQSHMHCITSCGGGAIICADDEFDSR